MRKKSFHLCPLPSPTWDWGLLRLEALQGTVSPLTELEFSKSKWTGGRAFIAHVLCFGSFLSGCLTLFGDYLSSYVLGYLKNHILYLRFEI